MIFWAYLIYLEYKQLRYNENFCAALKDYLKDFWNLNDIVHLTLVLVLAINGSFGEKLHFLPINLQVVLAAIATSCICLKFFDWLRLFDRTSFYINLIGMTLSEVKYFLILLMASMFMFGLPLMILNLKSEPGQEIIEKNSIWNFTNTLIHQYQLALGTFYYKQYHEHSHATLVWLLFFLSTGFTQITMLNMLIAIMGDTFDKVTENSKVYTTRTKLQILGDYSGNFAKSETDRLFLFTMTVNTDEDPDEQGDWEGSIKTMRKFTQKMFEQLDSKFASKLDKMMLQMETTSLKTSV